MNPFLKKLIIFFAIFLVILEIFSRVIIDPFYFFSIKTYNERKGLTLDKIYSKDESDNVDFLFVGSSRIPATINHQLIYKLSNGKVAINAGRGYLTPGIHYQAIKSKLKDYPDFLKNSIVIIEYAGSDVYCTNFEDDLSGEDTAIFKSDFTVRLYNNDSKKAVLPLPGRTEIVINCPSSNSAIMLSRSLNPDLITLLLSFVLNTILSFLMFNA